MPETVTEHSSETTRFGETLRPGCSCSFIFNLHFALRMGLGREGYARSSTGGDSRVTSVSFLSPLKSELELPCERLCGDSQRPFRSRFIVLAGE